MPDFPLRRFQLDWPEGSLSLEQTWLEIVDRSQSDQHRFRSESVRSDRRLPGTSKAISRSAIFSILVERPETLYVDGAYVSSEALAQAHRKDAS